MADLLGVGRGQGLTTEMDPFRTVIAVVRTTGGECMLAYLSLQMTYIQSTKRLGCMLLIPLATVCHARSLSLQI